ncbi:MAG: hypothetical protein GY774_11710 [Planctomycetes bacterium]|nr:hypothetical protein [Planctomycetota bacterium]
MTKKIIFWFIAVAVLLMAENPRADAQGRKVLSASRARRPRVSNIKPVEIHSGFVIVKGHYIMPPYLIESKRGRIYINGFELPQMNQTPFFRRNIGMRYFNQTSLNQAVNQIEQNLRRDAMLIYTHSNSTVYTPAQQAIPILDVLLSNEKQDTKVQMLMQIGPSWIDSGQWALLVETFEAPAELSERVLALKQNRAELSEIEDDDELSMSFLSGITIIGFILAVWAFGTLLNCRPPVINSGQAINPSKTPCRQVIWLVILIIVLNIYDLVCTLFAQGVGGLWELNPFAGPLVENVPMIVIFKLSLTIGAAILLVVGRRLKVAQIGVWWAGVLYTVLIIRWTVFNSIFL